MAKEQYTIRLESELLKKLKYISSEEFRSLNNQIEYFLLQSTSSWEKENYQISSLPGPKTLEKKLSSITDEEDE